MSKSILGSDLAEEQPIRYSFSPSSGYSTTRTWRSAKLSALNALTPGLAAGRWQWEITAGFGVHTLTATFAGLGGGDAGQTPPEEAAIVTWELMSNRFEKDLLESTILPLAGVQLDKDDIKEIKKALDETETDLDYLSARGAIPYEIFLLMQKGVRSAVLNQPILHRSQIVSQNYLVKASFENAGKIIKTATLKTQEAIPDTILFQLPDLASPTDVLFPNNGPNPGFPKTPRLRYGWYKNTPTAQQVSANKFQISQTWEYGLWAKLLYGEPI